MKYTKGLVIGSVFGIALLGCAPNVSSLNYTTNQTGIAAQTARGTILAATPVNISGSRGGLASNVGTIVGAVAGGVAGSSIGGGGTANTLGAIGGAVVGGTLGHVAQGRLTQQVGMQYQVRLRNKSVVTITQGMNPPFGVGQHVFVIYSNPARIVADPNAA